MSVPLVTTAKLQYQVALSLATKIGPKLARQLVSYCGGAEQVFQATPRELTAVPGIGRQLASSIDASALMRQAERVLRRSDQLGLSIHFYLDRDYPNRLKQYPDSPILIYQKGKASLNADRHLGVVGTRRASQHGLQTCRRFIDGLTPYQPTVVSGLAYGIDIQAHRSSLDQGLPTIAVLAHGHDYIYPSLHRKAAEQIVEGGATISEYPPSIEPEREHFPMRNRIIAGLSDALVVVETKKKGGSMITAELANGYHKEVFAVPGRSQDPLSEGTNWLIKTHRASLADQPGDISYSMNWEKQATVKLQKKLFLDLSDAQRKVVALLDQQIDRVLDPHVLPPEVDGNQLNELILDLECRGLIRSLPGNRYLLA